MIPTFRAGETRVTGGPAMRFDASFWGLYPQNSPNSPLRALSGGRLSPGPDYVDLFTEFTVSGGDATVHALLTGYVGFSRELDAAVLDILHLNSQGRPQPYLSLYAIMRGKNPQLMPLPARISYRFPSCQPRLRTALAALISSRGDRPSVPVRDRYGDRVAFSSDDDFRARYESVIFDEGGSLFISGGDQLGTLSDGELLVLDAWDYKTYGAVDQPLCIIGESVAPSGTPTIPNGARIDAVYRTRDTYRPGEAGRPAAAEDFDPRSADATSYADSSEAINNRIIVRHDDLLSEADVVVHFTSGASTTKALYQLDPYEKWSLFPSDLRWHVKNWWRAGFIGSHGSLLTELATSLDRPLNPNPIFVRARATSPPVPIINEYSDGEARGIERPIYQIVSVPRLRFHVPKLDQIRVRRDGTRRRIADEFSIAEPRNFSVFHYQGADGIEEYVKRVAAHEFSLSGLRQLARDYEAFKAQIIVARSYFLHAWYSGRRGLETPIAQGYASEELRPTAAFHVHRLDTLNDKVKGTEGERIRELIEEAIAETWGQVVTFRGQLADTEFFAGDPNMPTTIEATAPVRPYMISVFTDFGINPARLNDDDYKGDYGHGRGFSQKGSKALAASGLTYLQIVHWFYFGTEVRNSYAQGDILTLSPTGEDWIATPGPNPHPVPSLHVSDGRWSWSSSVAETDAFDWHLSHNFKASEFCTSVNGDAIHLDIDVYAVQKLQRLRYRIQHSRGIRIRGIQFHAATPPGYSIHVECHDNDFQALAEEIFGADRVEADAEPDRWNLFP